VPTAAGSRTATLVVKDNATGGVQTVSLTGAANDFTIGTAVGGSSSTVTAGNKATYTISVGGAGFTGQVNLKCSGAPTNAQCDVIPTFVTLNGSTPASATVTVITFARTSVIMPVTNRDERWTPSTYKRPRILGAASVVALLFLWLAVYWWHTRRRMSWVAVAATAALVLASVATSGCGGGGGSSNTGSTGGTTFGTPAGTYALTVTATTGSGASAVSHTTNLTLVVR
jgi:hypothetical protein